MKSVVTPAPERDDLNRFLEKHLNINIDTNSLLGVTRNERRHRKFVGKVTAKIVTQLFQIVRDEASRLNLYTYEIESDSKASKIFLSESFDFENEEILHAELLAYFASNKARGANARFIRDNIDPLSFDPALEADYIAALRSDRKKLSVMDELEYLYEEEVLEFITRREMLAAAASDYLDYGTNDGDEL